MSHRLSHCPGQGQQSIRVSPEIQTYILPGRSGNASQAGCISSAYYLIQGGSGSIPSSGDGQNSRARLSRDLPVARVGIINRSAAASRQHDDRVLVIIRRRVVGVRIGKLRVGGVIRSGGQEAADNTQLWLLWLAASWFAVLHAATEGSSKSLYIRFKNVVFSEAAQYCPSGAFAATAYSMARPVMSAE